jgi:formamidopyrimidine-DNA glycosylase
MIEFPEAQALSAQLTQYAAGRKVLRVLPPAKAHKFCWFQGDPALYDAALRGATITGAEGFGGYAELKFNNGKRLCIQDGVQARLIRAAQAPKNYQLLIEMTDGSALCFTVALYGGILVHEGGLDNPYYQKSRAALPPDAPDFPAHFEQLYGQCSPTMSLKAFLATQQRFPGIGNGVIQDVLFAARLNPKQKLQFLGAPERAQLCASLIHITGQMRDQGGRDTEKDLFGSPGGYVSLLSKNTWMRGCPCCGAAIVKEAYLGGAVYYCPQCQPL